MQFMRRAKFLVNQKCFTLMTVKSRSEIFEHGCFLALSLKVTYHLVLLSLPKIPENCQGRDDSDSLYTGCEQYLIVFLWCWKSTAILLKARLFPASSLLLSWRSKSEIPTAAVRTADFLTKLKSGRHRPFVLNFSHTENTQNRNTGNERYCFLFVVVHSSQRQRVHGAAEKGAATSTNRSTCAEARLAIQTELPLNGQRGRAQFKTMRRQRHLWSPS